MAIFFLTNDLMFSSRVTSFAGNRGSEVKVRSTCEGIATEINKDENNLVILDLSLPGCDPNKDVPKLRDAAQTGLKIVAFAPHVHESKLDAARDANCDVVLTKGQFNGQIGELLTSHFGQSSGD